MTKKIIHFAHANSFPAQTYQKLFTYLSDDFEVGYLDRHGHNPMFPVTDGWKHLADELRHEIESRYTEPIIGLGHSLGGILHFIVACEHPHLYKAIILLDSPLVSRLSGTILKLFKVTKLAERYSPSRGARLRRNLWRTKDEVHAHFSRKALFAGFDSDILRDYANHATIETPKGIELYFQPKIEASIYRTLPDSFSKYRGKLVTPAYYIGGTNSREARLARLSFMRRNFDFKFQFIPGTHLFPFERPQETAKLIKRICSDIS